MALAVLMLATLAQAQEPKKYHTGQLLQMESLQCTVFVNASHETDATDRQRQAALVAPWPPSRPTVLRSTPTAMTSAEVVSPKTHLWCPPICGVRASPVAG